MTAPDVRRVVMAQAVFQRGWLREWSEGALQDPEASLQDFVQLGCFAHTSPATPSDWRDSPQATLATCQHTQPLFRSMVWRKLAELDGVAPSRRARDGLVAEYRRLLLEDYKEEGTVYDGLVWGKYLAREVTLKYLTWLGSTRKAAGILTATREQCSFPDKIECCPPGCVTWPSHAIEPHQRKLFAQTLRKQYGVRA